MQNVKLAKIIREFAGLNPWEMHKKMGKKSVQAYLSLERKAKRITPQDLAALEQIYLEYGGTHDKFWEILTKETK